MAKQNCSPVSRATGVLPLIKYSRRPSLLTRSRSPFFRITLSRKKRTEQSFNFPFFRSEKPNIVCRTIILYCMETSSGKHIIPCFSLFSVAGNPEFSRPSLPGQQCWLIRATSPFLLFSLTLPEVTCHIVTVPAFFSFFFHHQSTMRRLNKFPQQDEPVSEHVRT